MLKMDDKQSANYSIDLQENKTTDCDYLAGKYVEERFWLVSVFGTTVATLSIVQNSFLFAILIAK